MTEGNDGLPVVKTGSVRQTRSAAAYFVPAIADILMVGIILRETFLDGASLLADCDTGYHIRAGQYILRTLSVPEHDIFSFITPPLPWTAHEWLSEVLMALLHKASGLTGVAIFFGCLIAFTYALFFRTLQKRGGNILVNVLVALLVMVSSELHWLARPHVFSLLFMVIWYYLLDEYQYRNRNYLFAFPFMMLLWVNLHGGFIIGFVLSGVYFLDNMLKALRTRNAEKEKYVKKTLVLGGVIAICLAVSLINPRGYRILLFPFAVTTNRVLMDHVIEFLSPNFHDPMPFKYLLFAMIALFGLTAKRLNFVEIVLTVLFLNMALYSMRYIPLFCIIAAPIVVRQAEEALRERGGRVAAFFEKRNKVIGSVDASAKGHLWPVAAIAVACVLALNGSVEIHFDKRIKPVAAVEFLKGEHIEGHMFNDDEFGDYLIYAASDKYKVFFDGRSDMYGADRIKEYFKVILLEDGWEDVLKKHDITWVFYGANSVLSRSLLERNDWKLIYADKVADIFVKNIPENAALIEKYRDVRPVKQSAAPGAESA